MVVMVEAATTVMTAVEVGAALTIVVVMAKECVMVDNVVVVVSSNTSCDGEVGW